MNRPICGLPNQHLGLEVSSPSVILINSPRIETAVFLLLGTRLQLSRCWAEFLMKHFQYCVQLSRFITFHLNLFSSFLFCSPDFLFPLRLERNGQPKERSALYKTRKNQIAPNGGGGGASTKMGWKLYLQWIVKLIDFVVENFDQPFYWRSEIAQFWKIWSTTWDITRTFRRHLNSPES